MSQAKVDKYKSAKANRRETIAKEKRQKMIAKIAVSIVGVALVAWIGVSGVIAIYDARPVNKYFVTMDSLDKYLESLNPEETTEDSEKKEDTTEKEDSTEKETSTEDKTDAPEK